MFGRVRSRFAGGVGRVRASGWAVAQSAVAASLAFFIAQVVLGHERPFFAPIAAVICLSFTHGSRPRRALEIVFGVAVGLMVADLLVLFIGTGTVQIAVVVLLAMVAAIFSGGGTILVNQAAVSAILVVVLQPPDAVFSPNRFLDALAGGVEHGGAVGGELGGDFLDFVEARAEKDLFLQKEGSALPPALSEINFQYYIFWVFRY